MTILKCENILCILSSFVSFDLGLQDSKILKYTAPYVLATALASYLPFKKDARILDVGAGTGLVAKRVCIHQYLRIFFCMEEGASIFSRTDVSLKRDAGKFKFVVVRRDR